MNQGTRPRETNRKVAQTELDPNEYRILAKTAEKRGLSIKEALRQAARLWIKEQSEIDSKDRIFDIPLGRRKPRDSGKGTEHASREVDETLYKRRILLKPVGKAESVKGKYKGLLKVSLEQQEEAQERFVSAGHR